MPVEKWISNKEKERLERAKKAAEKKSAAKSKNK